ncbi:MAG: bifunctional 5,10-methylenetetrahydrofolate dehydrogenase/5,10-methenyltetrahydrofolate cyclohydrolase [bacterium]|nr:bifunctional 5,10-methylenetetrahydrofolate dehydrogenase/5,10-methenyltetrahydrofolate cyclohydrolase [bacterium]
MIIDGRAIAEDLYSSLGKRRGKLKKDIKLGIIIGGVNPVIESFVRIKTRAAARLSVEMVRVDLPEGVDTATAMEAIEELEKRTDAVIVQLPLPKEIETHIALATIPAEKDVDAINPTIPDNEHPVFAPVALAVVEVLKRTGINPKGKRTVVVGAGRLVGAPSAVLLKRLGADVSLFTLEEGSIDDLKDADIVVLGVGKPGYIKPKHIKKGVALIDAGASEVSGKIQGDADPACAEKAHVFTPVPGGIGPIAVAMIFRNLFDLIEGKKS